MTIAALTLRLAVASVLCLPSARVATMTIVHSNDPDDPNKSFARYSEPTEFKFSVTKPEAFDFLVPGAVYDLVMVPSGGAFAISVAPVSADEAAPVLDANGSAAKQDAALLPPAADAGATLSDTAALAPLEDETPPPAVAEVPAAVAAAAVAAADTPPPAALDQATQA